MQIDDGHQHMELNEYQTLAGRTEKDLPETFRLMHHALGVASEAGEICTLIKAHLIYGKPLDGADLREELGDLLWFAARLAAVIETPLSEVAFHNIAKLRRRYPEQYSDRYALDRLDKKGGGDDGQEESA